MGSFVHKIRAFAFALGAPGLFIVAFLDSSLLSLPEIADLMVMWMVTRHKSLVLLYVLSATAGSVAGCLVLYFLGKWGGEALLHKRFGSASVERTLNTFRRYGVMAVLIPSLLPPPAPFKIFVLLAGFAEITTARFTLAVTIGRGARYLIEGLLAVRYGDRAVRFVHENAITVSLAAVGLLFAGLVLYVVWSKAQAGKRR